jgi:carboxylesterase type B
MKVTPNFRLGALGFLALPELSAADPRGSSGNYALLDIQLALQWVQANAHAFGGDAQRVTLIGQSSGGTNILALLASPTSVGLFSAGISLSGSPNITMDLTKAEEQGTELVNNAHCSSNCIDSTDPDPETTTTTTDTTPATGIYSAGITLDATASTNETVLDCLYSLSPEEIAHVR